MMRNRILLIILIVVGLSGCTQYNRLLKSNDVMSKYSAAMGFYKAKKYQKAIALFDSSLPTLVGTPYEDTILFMLGKTFYESKDFSLAGEMMNQYRNRFPRSPFTPEAEYIYAMSFYHLSADVERDQNDTRRAIVAFGEYMNRHPQSPFNVELARLTEELHTKLYYKRFLNSALYFKLGHYLSAITSLRDVLKENPETPYREEIMFMICKSWYEYARNSVYARQLDRYLKMIDAYYNFATAYPTSKQFGREAERMLGIAQEFVDKNGVTSQALESSAAKIKAAQLKIEQNKDKIFFTKTRAEKDVLREQIKEARQTIKVERKTLIMEQKTLKNNEKKTK